jgi:hypothetical protein
MYIGDAYSIRKIARTTRWGGIESAPPHSPSAAPRNTRHTKCVALAPPSSRGPSPWVPPSFPSRARPVSQLRRHHRPPPLPTRALDARELALLVGNCSTSCAHPPPGRPPPETHPLDSLLVRSAAGAARVEQFGAPADEEEQRQIILFCRSRLGERNVPGGEAG